LHSIDPTKLNDRLKAAFNGWLKADSSNEE
jgi:hypothetical protein